MSDWRIPLSDLAYGPEEAEAAARVLRNKWLSMGPETKAFEEEFSALTGSPHSIAVANGTAALHLALLALGLGPGDEVIQPAVNFVASANMTVAVGAKPVFADIPSLAEPVLNPAAVRAQLTPRTRAIIVMHYGGWMGAMADLAELCQEHKLWLIEDACHAVGATCSDAAQRIPHGRQAGNLGDLACFSFFSNKNLVTGEGGMITTRSDEVNEKLRRLRSHGMTSLTWDRHRGHASTYDVMAHGYNYRLDDLRSALGRAQLAKLSRHNARRRELAALYWQELAPLAAAGWSIPFAHRGPPDSATAAHLMAVVAPTAETRWQAAEALKQAGIQSSLHYPLIPGFTGFKAYRAVDHLPHSVQFCQRVITLPLYPTLSEDSVRTVCQVLNSL